MLLASGSTTSATMRILVADQSRTMRNIARAVLAQLGYYDVDEAADANEAVSRACFADFDLCIFDHSMRGRDGTPLSRALEQAGSRARQIVLSTADNPSTEAEASHSLRKPFAPEALRRCIDAVVASQPTLRAA
ncbi:MAG: response regulator [Phycisphaerales bacterium]